MVDRAAIVRGGSLEDLQTSEILALHEHVFGPLDPLAKRRITQTASMNGWDRTWNDAPHAA
jgi:hypothetical protein